MLRIVERRILMRKVFKVSCAVVCVLSMMFSGICAAEAIDVATMSLEELVELDQTIDKEIALRTGENQDNVISGVFIGGKNISVGQYIFICPVEDDESCIYLYNTQESYKEGERYDQFYSLYYGDKFMLYIEEGMTLEVYDVIIETLDEIE